MNIKAQKREIAGKKVKAIRSQDQIPAVVYGPSQPSTNLVIDYKEFVAIYHKVGYSKMIKLQFEGEEKGEDVLIKEIQEDPLSHKVIHVSFYQVDMNRIITIDVPIVYEGTPKAMKTGVGFLVTPVTEILVRSLPSKLPSEIVVNVENLENVGDSILSEQINLPEGVEYDASVPLKNAVAYIAPPQKEIVEEAPVAAEGAEGEAAAEGATPAEGAKPAEGEKAPEEAKK
jgi:large subunit ribosomal protein L25